MDLKNVIMMTDVDGTVLNSKKQVSEKDLRAIAELRAAGGIFTVATGRGYSMAMPIIDMLSITTPAVIFNGAAVYDFQAAKFLWHCSITDKAKQYAREIAESIDDVAIEVLSEKTVYVPCINDVERWHLKLGNVDAAFCGFDDIPENDWIKVLIAYPGDKMDKVIDFVNAHDYSGVNWVRSGEVFYEMLPEGISKGAGLRKLVELTGNEKRFTVAAGDYMNDRDMIIEANLGVAVANALPEVKAAADLVVCDNDSSPISEIIDYIKKL